MPAERPPASFSEELREEWHLWVLEHGLPDLPDGVAVGESVPVARWEGPEFGAVLHVEWSWDEDHSADELSSEIQVYRRTTTGWEPALGAGGGNWYEPPLERRPMEPRSAGLVHFHSSSNSVWTCCAAYGFAGSDATVIEVVDSAGLTRQVMESPIGVFVVCADGRLPARVRVLARDGTVLYEQPFSPADGWDRP